MFNEDFTPFESLAFHIIKHEATPSSEGPHISMDILLGLLDETLPSIDQERARAHLAMCDSCADRFAQLQDVSQTEAQSLKNERWGTLPNYLESQRAKSAKARLFRFFSSALPKPRLRRKLLAAWSLASAIVIAIALIIGGLHPEFLFGPSVSNNSGLSAKAIAASSTIPERTALEVIAALDHTVVYYVSPGDTWASVAQEYIGDASWWPLLIVFNRDNPEASRGMLPAVGAPLLVPQRPISP